MKLELLSLADLEGLAAGHPLRGRKCLEGAFPPAFIITSALANLRAGKEPLWHSFFVMVDDWDGAIAGTGGFKGAPVAGDVEIGYGVTAERQRRGLATAAVRELVRIAACIPEVWAVTAKTALANTASRRVVQKAGFSHSGSGHSVEDGPLDIWRLELKTPAPSAPAAPAGLS